MKYTDLDGKKALNFNYKEYIQQQLYAETCVIDAGIRDFIGKIGNSFLNIFTGHASYQVYTKASLTILNFECKIFDLEIGSKGKDLSFALDQKATDKFMESFEKLIDSPITLTTSKLKVKVGVTDFTFQTDGTNLKVKINVGKDKKFNLGDVGEGKFNICSGINISTNMDDGPMGTINNGKSPAIENDKSDYSYYKSSDRIFELIE